MKPSDLNDHYSREETCRVVSIVIGVVVSALLMVGTIVVYLLLK